MNLKTTPSFFLLFSLIGLAILFTINVSAQTTSGRKVAGKVTDETGNGVSGVTVTVKGTRVATQTDDNGNYTVNAPANSTLVFTSVGFAPSEVASQGKTTINATLSGQTSRLNEVVVVGYGTQ